MVTIKKNLSIILSAGLCVILSQCIIPTDNDDEPTTPDPASYSILSPKAGEIYKVGDTMHIQILVSPKMSSLVVDLSSKDGNIEGWEGVNYPDSLFLKNQSKAFTVSYDWVVLRNDPYRPSLVLTNDSCYLSAHEYNPPTGGTTTVISGVFKIIE